MARSFNGTTDVITANPVGTGNHDTAVFSVSCWCLITALGGTQIAISDGNNGADGFQLMASLGSGGNHVVAQFFLDYGLSMTPNVWGNIIFSYNGPGSHGNTGYFNGAAISPSFVSMTMPPTVSFTMGSGLAGRIADVAFWDGINLTQGEATALAQGARPNQIRPSKLVGWWPLDGLKSPEPDLSGKANNGVLTGTALAAGPPVMMLTPRWPQTTPAGAAASSVVYRRSLSALGARTGSRQVQL